MGLDEVLNDVTGTPEPEAEPEEVETEEPEHIDEEIGKGPEDEDDDEPSDDEEAEDPEDGEEESPKARNIPLKAHLAERAKLTERAREAEAKARQYELQNAQMQAWFQAQQQQAQQPPAPSPPPQPAVEVEPPPEFRPTVDYGDNPAQFLREQNAHMQALLAHQQKANTAQLEALKNETKAEREQRQQVEKQRQEQQQQAQQQQQWAAQVDQKIRASEAKAAEDLPGYHEAISYLFGVLQAQAVAELVMYGVPEADIPAMSKELLRQRTRNSAAHVISKGLEPAEEVYKYAKRMGWAPKASTKLDRVEEGVNRTRGPGQMSSGGTGAGKSKGGSDDIFLDAQREAGLRR